MVLSSRNVSEGNTDDSPYSLFFILATLGRYWNRVSVNKLFIEQPSPESKVKVMIPMYEPLEVAKCKKCGKIIAEQKRVNSLQ